MCQITLAHPVYICIVIRSIWTMKYKSMFDYCHLPWFCFCFQNLDNFWVRIAVANNLIVLISIGLLFDKCAFIYSSAIEIVRCGFYVYFMRMYKDNSIDYLIYYVHLFQLSFIWIPFFVYKIYTRIYTCFFTRGYLYSIRDLKNM